MLNFSGSDPGTLVGRAKGRATGGNHQVRRRERFYDLLKQRPLPGIDRREVDAHFAAMPMRYWERVTKAELIWGLEVVHCFQHRSAARGDSVVLADSRHYPERGFTKVLVCAWDRLGLLAKIAAGFSALRLNILRADVYTREDGLALDLFEVGDLHDGRLAGSEGLRQLVFLVEGALSDPPRFVSLWASQFHKVLPPSKLREPTVMFDNDSSGDQTVVRIEGEDRLGLLHDLLRALSECGVNVTEALVETENETASDVFYITERKGGKILDASRLEVLRHALIRAMTA